MIYLVQLRTCGYACNGYASYKTALYWTAKVVASCVSTLLYYLLASPPIHWWYDAAPPAGPASVYVPGELVGGRKVCF